MKHLIVNCDLCDMRTVKEETLKSYESITINGDTVLVTTTTKDLIARYPVMMNIDKVIELPADEDVKLQSVNGSMTIDGTVSAAAEKTYLFINGSLTIGEDGLEAAKSYYHICVNGSVRMPASFAGQLTNINADGSIKAYPDGATLLKATTMIDQLFALRAKHTLYFAEKRLVFVDPALNADALAAKGATFESPKVVIAEALCEGIVPLIDEKADIKVVADGTVFVDGNATLDDALVNRCGKKLYLNGSLTLNAESEAALATLEKLYVNGTVKLPAALKDAFMKLDAEYAKLEVVRAYSRVIANMPYAKVDKTLLEKSEKGVLVTSCAMVKLADDIPADLIYDRLAVSSCAIVRCTEEQEAAVSAVGDSIAQIGAGDDESVGGIFGIGSIIKNAISGIKDQKVVNTDTYVM